MKSKKLKNVVFYGSCSLIGVALGLGEYFVATKAVTALYDKIFKNE